MAALERSPDSYQHVEPSKVGNELRVLISELSGRQNILGKIKKLDLDIGDDIVAERALVILDRVKKLESSKLLSSKMSGILCVSMSRY